jgi:type II secretory ATPase GspE/PulE/Tfp pilus assembly ATPase PilB-like protein
MSQVDKQISAELLKRQLISEELLAKAENESRKLKAPFYLYLLENKHIEEDALLSIMSLVMNMPVVNLRNFKIDESAIKAVPIRFAWHYEFIPLKLEGRKLTIAMNDPSSIKVQDEIRTNLGYEISILLAKKADVLELLKVHYGLGADTVDKMVKSSTDTDRMPPLQPPHGIEDIEKLAGDASVIKLVNQILLDAYKKRATDIHIEPFRGKLRLRYRVDGVLYDQNVPENLRHFLLPILSRIKVMSNLNIVERRMPQDGRAIVKTQEQILDLRVSFMPTPHGESVVIRLLPTNMFLGLDTLGLNDKDLVIVESLLEKPNGIVFVTGPTGSGKTTTLYAFLMRLNKQDRKIITIEDPVEYEMEGITQIQVNPDIQLTFASGLRSMLRHDPDVIMVGEVRDKETAQIAIRVALTGHLVFSTLHTNDAVSGIARLMDIGIEPYLIISTVEAFIAQRLIRQICQNCKTIDTGVDKEHKKEMMANFAGISADDIQIYKGKGCEKCNFTGFYGRTAIYEILLMDKDLKKMVLENAALSDIKARAVKKGMRTLLQDGWEKVMRGVTTPQEILEATQDFKLEETTDQKDSGGESLIGDITVPKNDVITDKDDRRIYVRAPSKISIRYRLVEKGEGEVIKLNKEVKDVGVEDVFTKEIFQKDKSGDSPKKYLEETMTSTNNISAGGLSFESQYMFPIGSILDLTIELPYESAQIRSLARVVRVDKDLPNCFYVVVCYLDMAGADRRRIDGFVQKEVSKQNIVKFTSP